LELVEGGDLLDYILKNNGLNEDDSKHITYQICDALAVCHLSKLFSSELMVF
jgi:ser/thr/tyr protein kinase RAD53